MKEVGSEIGFRKYIKGNYYNHYSSTNWENLKLAFNKAF